MIENFQALIGAKIKDFQNKMKQVDRKVKETAMEAVKPIDVDIDDLMWGLREADAKVKEFTQKSNKHIGADISEFMWNLREVEAETKIVLRPADKSIGADISRFMRKAAEVAVVARNLAREKVVIVIEARIKKFQATLGRVASNIRSMGELISTTFRGIGISLAPALVPLISTLVGLIGQLGPMVGTLAGSTFALASAFGAAGIAAGAFTAIAVSNLKDVFGASSDIKDIQEKLAGETDEKKRAKLLEELAQVQGSLNKEQTSALKAMNKLNSVWKKLSDNLQKPTIKIFTDFLGIMGDVLGRTIPLFRGAVTAVQSLTTSLGKALKGESMMAFFKYLNTTAGPMLETIGKAFGNFTQGVLSMMVAFGPLSESTAKGFQSMSERFAEWAAGLSESKKFQTFVDYVNTNMPKIRAIFGDAFKGIINTFAAFAPSSADMMTSLQDMMKRFREWSSTLSENQAFQDFISYIKTNGPTVVSTIGNIITAIVNIGIALAPMGEKILELVNGFIAWSNEMMKNHPILGKIGAAVLLMTGLLIAIAPNIIAFGTLFGGAATAIWTATALMRAKFVLGMGMMLKSMLITSAQMVKTAALMVAKWVWMGVQSLLQAGRMAAAWFIALGPIGWVIGAIVGLAILIIANWDKIKEVTIKVWKAVSTFVVDTVAKIMGYIQEKFPAIYNIIMSYMESVKTIIQTVWNYIKGTFTNILSFLKALVTGDFQGMKDAISKQMALSKETISKIWGTIKSFFVTVLGEIVKKLSEKFGEMPDVILSFVGKMKQAGADLIAGVISGITGKISEGLDAIGGFAKGLLARFKQDTDTHSPSRAFENISKWFAPGIVNGINKTSHLAVNSVSDMATRLTNAFSPELAIQMSDLQMSPLDTHSQIDSLKRQIKQELSVDMSVNHKGIGQTGGGIVQNIEINSNTPLSPSEIKNEQLKASRQLAMEWGV